MKNPSRLLIAVVGLSAAACSKPQAFAAVAAKPVAVRVVKAKGATEGKQLQFTAVVRPARQVELDFKVPGYVRRVAKVGSRLIQDGDAVTSGQVLAEVDKSDYDVKMDAARSVVAESQAALAQARLDQGRTQRLVEHATTSKVQLERANTQLQLAEARGARAQSSLREASLAYRDATLRSPMDGIILKRTVEEGALVGPRYPGFILAEVATVKLVFSVPDSHLGVIHLGQTLESRFEAMGQSFSGTVTRIAPVADSRSHTFDVELSIPNPDQKLKVGMVGNVALSRPSSSPLFALPINSLVRGASPRSVAVYVVDAAQHRASLREVKINSVVRDQALVEGALQLGDEVATLGAALLYEGASVTIIP